MGWTGTHATYYKNGKVDRKTECDMLLTFSNNTVESKVLKSRMVSSVYYAAVEQIRNGNREVFGAVILTSGEDRNDPYFNFHYKEMCESSGPYEYKCPESILKLLTPTDSDWALDWRRRCQEYNDKRKNKQTVGTLPVGSKIKFKRYDGTEVILQKMPPSYQFKRCWWYIPETRKYMSTKYIPDDFEIID